ncbi:MAG: OstA family protein [Alphaproteobacteria bacterium]|nr:OstA family protein [Alphaproteobacteria bacterium]
MRYAPILLSLGLLAAVPVLGQALKGHDAKSPVDVEADRIEVQDRADRAIFSGNVLVRQANLTLTAGRLTVAYARQGGGVDIDRLDASGGVMVKSPSETARGDFAVYDLNKRLITLVGGVELTQGSNRVQGGRMVIDLDTGRATVDGRGTPGSSTSGRVSGRFTVAGAKK